MQAAVALSLGQPAAPAPAMPASPPLVRVEESNEAEPEPTAEALAQLVFGAHATPTVLRQWHSQGFRLGAAADGPATAGGVLPFGAGLEQEHGGPCAVLSAAQATTNHEPKPEARPRPSPSPNAHASPNPNPKRPRLPPTQSPPLARPSSSAACSTTRTPRDRRRRLRGAPRRRRRCCGRPRHSRTRRCSVGLQTSSGRRRSAATPPPARLRCRAAARASPLARWPCSRPRTCPSKGRPPSCRPARCGSSSYPAQQPGPTPHPQPHPSPYPYDPEPWPLTL